MALKFHFTDFPKVIAHRGLSAFAPENTLPAFLLAAQKGMTWVECDVRLSKDGVPMVFHDATLERTSNGTGLFSGLSLSELKQLDAGSWFSAEYAGTSIPTLDELLSLALNVGLGINIEIKPNVNEDLETVEQMNHLLQSRTQNPPILFSSYSVDSLKHCVQLLPQYPRALVTDGTELLSATEIVALSESLGCTSLHMNLQSLYTDLLKQAFYAPFDIMCFTVNDFEVANRCWRAGCASVFSDNGFIDDTILV